MRDLCDVQSAGRSYGHGQRKTVRRAEATTLSPRGRAIPPRDERRRPRRTSAARGWRRLERRSLRDGSKRCSRPTSWAFKAKPSWDFVRASPGFAGPFGCDRCDGQCKRQDVLGADGRKIAGRASRRDGIEPSLYVSTSSQQLGSAFRFVGIGGHGHALSAGRRRTFQAHSSFLRLPSRDREEGARSAREPATDPCRRGRRQR